MKINKAGLELVKQFEGFRADAYKDLAGIYTIGYGSTQGINENTPRITQMDAEKLLRDDLNSAEHLVTTLITKPLTSNQFSALVSLVFNCGGAPLRGTLGKRLNMGDYHGASLIFEKWCNARVNGVLTPIKGLLRRRLAEKALFLSTESGE